MDKFEGREVVSATVKIMKAGDGLSDALKLDPVMLDLGAEVNIVLRGSVQRVSFQPTKDDPEQLARVHVIFTEEVALVTAEDVEHMLGANRERLAQLREDLAGVTRLPFDPDLLDGDDDVPDVIRDNLGGS